MLYACRVAPYIAVSVASSTPATGAASCGPCCIRQFLSSFFPSEVPRVLMCCSRCLPLLDGSCPGSFPETISDSRGHCSSYHTRGYSSRGSAGTPGKETGRHHPLFT